jgi:hypothetical protein
MKTFMLSDVECPQVVFEVGGHEIESTIIKSSKKTPNFDKPLLFLDVVRTFIERIFVFILIYVVRCYQKKIFMLHQ